MVTKSSTGKRPVGRPLGHAPDGERSRVRSVQLEPHVDALVARHMAQLGFPNVSAALRDLVDRGLATTGALSGVEGGDQRARAYREASAKVEAEARAVVRGALAGFLERSGAAVPSVRVTRKGR